MASTNMNNHVDDLNQDSNLLCKIDHCIQSLSKCKQSETNNLVKEFAVIILQFLRLAEIDNPTNSLFDQGLSQSEKRFIAICLLRLLAINDYHFQQDRDFRIKAFTLFDNTLSDDIYKELGITTRQQTHEKHSRLQDAAPMAEEIYLDAVATLINLDRLEDFREKYMRTINNVLVKSIILPFIPRYLLHRSRLSELFESVRRYRQASVVNVREEYEDARRIIWAYLEDSRSCATKYTEDFVVVVAAQIYDFLTRDFLASDIGQPALLDIRAISKRYPLHQIKQEIKLGFTLSNQGSGNAYKVGIICSGSDTCNVTRQELHLGCLEPGNLIVEFPATVLKEAQTIGIEILVSWENADKSKQDKVFQFTLQGQRDDIDWGNLEIEDPYSLEPIETYEQLVGRKEILNNMVRQSMSRSVGSSYVYGQKRVGKTSIAKALRSRMSNHENHLVIYLEGGEYIDPDAQKTIGQLGKKICKKIKSNPRFRDLEIPQFENAISPLTDFLDLVTQKDENIRIHFILDEFDELPVKLYQRGELADAFFLTLRTISGKPPFGFVLVGGEKMEFIMSTQGDSLNKFLVITVDYFDKENQWGDFLDLVRKPTQDWLDITDEAIIDLYEKTAGNPYYTIFICRELFTMMVERKDCYVTRREINEATARSLKIIASNGFQHFWEDGIFEPTGDRVEEISMRRRRVLLAIANALREKGRASKDDIASQQIVSGYKDFIESDLRRFVERRVLIEENGLYDCKVPFFREWLTNNGVREILTTFTDLDAILDRRKREEEAFVKPEEVVALVSRWQDCLYQGIRVNEEHIRAWLNQFGDYVNQRLMFKVLQGIKFYSEDELRKKMREVHGIVTRGLVRHIKYRQQKRGDIIVSYLDGPGKSGGGRFAKLYADENEIYYRNVIESNELSNTLQEDKEIKAVVFIDDFVGSGGSLTKQLRALAEDHRNALQNQRLVIFFIAVTGFQQNQNLIEKTLSDLKLPIRVHICDPLDESDNCFSNVSRIFPDNDERVQAQKIAHEFGSQIVRTNSLGWGDCQAVIIFPDNCPNNTLPILWSESSNPPFRPLFKRNTR